MGENCQSKIIHPKFRSRIRARARNRTRNRYNIKILPFTQKVINLKLRFPQHAF